ncbi:MAG: gliding motility protein GldC [Saprospiraceae bacterium]|nr:gliding motility protein GldC [Saprospiraceae bacterium]
MSDPIAKTSTLTVKVGLDPAGIPIAIEWESEDALGKKEPVDCKAMLLSFFNAQTKETMKLDLWTKDMQVDEMDRFIFQTLRAMADTYFKATQNNKLAADMQRFVQYFGEQTEIIPRQQ